MRKAQSDLLRVGVGAEGIQLGGFYRAFIGRGRRGHDAGQRLRRARRRARAFYTLCRQTTVKGGHGEDPASQGVARRETLLDASCPVRYILESARISATRERTISKRWIASPSCRRRASSRNLRSTRANRTATPRNGTS